MLLTPAPRAKTSRDRPRRSRGRSVRARGATRARRRPALHALEGGDRVTFTSSFSKTVGARAARRLVRRPRGDARRLRRPRCLDVHLAAAPPAGDRPRAARARRLRAQPRPDPRDPPRAARRDARRARERARRARDLEPARGRVLPVARLRRRSRRRRAADARDRGRRHVRSWNGLLPGCRGIERRPACVLATSRPSGSRTAFACSPASSSSAASRRGSSTSAAGTGRARRRAACSGGSAR